ncbi:MAG: NAD-dependent dehydratase [Bacteroidetes bacterium]|nr:MAG: NAD-dependent dehydratase [Bacteroidota bacterium]
MYVILLPLFPYNPYSHFMYIILGSSGNTGKQIAQTLLDAGKPVTVVSRSAEHVADLVAKGAVPAIGQIEDQAFLTRIFTGATAVYALIPPNFATQDFFAYQTAAGDSIAAAAAASKVPNLVLLSSVGAHLSENSGVILGLHLLEEKLKAIPGLNTLAIRAGFFMQNFFGNIGLIKGMGIHGGFPIAGDVPMGMIHVRDIATYAAQRLLALDFSGYAYVNLPGQRVLTFSEATRVLGEAIGKPELPWVTFSYDDARNGMLQSGLSESLAGMYIEFSRAVNEGRLNSEAAQNPGVFTETSIEAFAQEFAGAYHA